VALGVGVGFQGWMKPSILDGWGMSGWGQRRLCSVTIVLVFGLAALLWRLGWLTAKLRRVPRFVWHVPAVLVLGSMIAWNVWRLHDLRGGKGAPSDPAPTCCDKTPTWARGPLAWVYYRIGNPFEFPANALFAMKHGVEIQRWDRAVGNYPLMPSWQSMLTDEMFDERGAWRIGYPRSEPDLVGHWSGTQTGEGQAMRWTGPPTVEAHDPNLKPYRQRSQTALGPGRTPSGHTGGSRGPAGLGSRSG